MHPETQHQSLAVSGTGIFTRSQDAFGMTCNFTAMENQMEKTMEDEIETGIMLGFVGDMLGIYWDNGK